MKKISLFIGFLILASCSTQTVKVETEISTEDWTTLDVGEFQVKAPKGWEYNPQMGIDSKVGEFSGDGMTLMFDYGAFSADFVNNSVYFEDPDAYRVTEETIDGYLSKIYVPVVPESDKPTVLFMGNTNGLGPCTEGVCGNQYVNLEILGDNLSEEEVEIALAIFKTVDFYENPMDDAVTEGTVAAGFQLYSGDEQVSDLIIRRTGCIDEECWYLTQTFLDPTGEEYPVPAGMVNHAGDGWVYIDANYGVYAYDAVSRTSEALMEVLDTYDGISYEWSPDDRKLAIVVINQEEESYRESYGSKLFVFSFDEDGKVSKKDRYLYKIKYGCHDAGCDSTAGQDFYFEGNDTLIYYTWEGDPYVERSAEYKRTVKL